MSILGQSQDGEHDLFKPQLLFSYMYMYVVYTKYASAIRQEYIHIPDDKYCSGRAQVLNNHWSH